MQPVMILAGASYRRTPVPGGRQVYVADQPQRSDPRAARNLGFGTLTDWLDPLAPDRARLAMVRLADGRLVAPPVRQIDLTGRVVARILPASPTPERRHA